MKNRYIRFSKISEDQFKEIVNCFADDLTATQITEITGLNRNTVNRYLKAIRERVAEFCEHEFHFPDTVTDYEFISGTKQIKGEEITKARNRGIMFGILTRKGKVYTETVPDCSKAILRALIRGKVELDSIKQADSWRGYDGLVDLDRKNHFRLDSGANDFFQTKSHTQNTEGFWRFASSRLVKFKGMQQSTFYLHLKECEFRFNYRDHDIDKLIMKMFEF